MSDYANRQTRARGPTPQRLHHRYTTGPSRVPKRLAGRGASARNLPDLCPPAVACLPGEPLVAALGRGTLALVMPAEIHAAIRPPGRLVECHERQLCDRQARVELDWHPRQVVELERQRPLPPGIAEPGGGVDDQAKPAQGAVVGWNERPGDEEDAVARGDLDTADGHALAPAYCGDRLRRPGADARRAGRERGGAGRRERRRQRERRGRREPDRWPSRQRA